MVKNILVSQIILYFILGCGVSLREAGSAYLRQNKNYAGVESPEQIFERLEKHERMRNIMYNNISVPQIINCTFLRNQIYVASLASLRSQDARELKQAADILERAYQQDVNAFLAACDQVLATRVGQVLSEIQARFLRANFSNE
jgi:hypothetical protein